MPATSAPTVFCVGPGSELFNDPAKATPQEERTPFERSFSPKSYRLQLGDKLEVKTSELDASLSPGTTLEILECAFIGYAGSTAIVSTDRNLGGEGRAPRLPRRTLHKYKTAPKKAASVYDIVAPFLEPNRRGGKCLPMKVVQHHVMKRGGWTRTTLEPLNAAVRRDSHDLPLLCLNLFEEAYYGTLQNVCLPAQGLSEGRWSGDRRDAAEATEKKRKGSDGHDIVRDARSGEANTKKEILDQDTNSLNTPYTAPDTAKQQQKERQRSIKRHQSQNPTQHREERLRSQRCRTSMTEDDAPVHTQS